MKFNYLILATSTSEIPILFGTELPHIVVANAMHTEGELSGDGYVTVSAGQTRLFVGQSSNEIIFADCFGKATNLNLKSNPTKDGQVIMQAYNKR